MTITNFIKRQVVQIRQGGHAVLCKKLKLVFSILHKLPLFILAIPVIVGIRLIKPWLLIRWGELHSPRIGHFASNTELYLCERDAGINVPMQRHADILFMEPQISNQQLAKMWSRVICVWPACVMSSICLINRLIPGGAIHEIGKNTQNDRDVHNLFDRFPSHLEFSAGEETRGKAGLKMIGIPKDALFVCLNVRDSAYLDAHQVKDWSYHDYRDCDIQNCILAAEELAERGYFVIRMGVKVKESIKSDHPRVIDYATNGMRSDFMDIYLGAKCEFLVGVGSGFDAVPAIFRRPIVSVNIVPLGYLHTFSMKNISIAKHYFSIKMNRNMTLREIFTDNISFGIRTSDYDSKGIQLIENTPEEIRDMVIEMDERLSGTWQVHPDDEAIQQRFWEIFSTYAVDAYEGNPIHGEIHARFGTAFLRNNPEWLK